MSKNKFYRPNYVYLFRNKINKGETKMKSLVLLFIV
jgi:hypothetical protein